MGIRRRFEQEWRTAWRQMAEAVGDGDGGQVNTVTRVNAVVVRNVGSGSASASASQTAPIVQEPRGKAGPAASATASDGPAEPQA